MPKKVCSVFENAKKYLTFLRKKFLMMIIWTHQKQFSQPCRKIFARRPEVFGSFLKKNRTHTYFSKKNIFLPIFLWQRTSRLGQSCWKSFDRKLKNFTQWTIMLENLHFFEKTTLGCSSGHVLTTGKFLVVVQKWRTKLFFLKRSHQNMSIETWNAVFSNLPKKTCRKAEFFFQS